MRYIEFEADRTYKLKITMENFSKVAKLTKKYKPMIKEIQNVDQKAEDDLPLELLEVIDINFFIDILSLATQHDDEEHLDIKKAKEVAETAYEEHGIMYVFSTLMSVYTKCLNNPHSKKAVGFNQTNAMLTKKK